MNNKTIFLLLVLLVLSFFLRLRMQEDEKIIEGVLKLEKERIEKRVWQKMSRVVMLSKRSGDYNKKVQEILEVIELTNSKPDTLTNFIEKRSKKDEFYKGLNIKKSKWYPKELRHLNQVEQIFDQLYEVVNFDGDFLYFQNLREIHPIVKRVEHQKNGLLTLSMQPFGVWDIEGSANYQFFIKDNPIEVNELPFFYSGDVKDIKCVFTSPITGQTFTYEGN